MQVQSESKKMEHLHLQTVQLCLLLHFGGWHMLAPVFVFILQQ